MAANLALSDSTVTLPNGMVVQHAHVLARDGVLRIRAEGSPDERATGVTYVERFGKDRWEITTDAGKFTAVTKGCGCG